MSTFSIICLILIIIVCIIIFTPDCTFVDGIFAGLGIDLFLMMIMCAIIGITFENNKELADEGFDKTLYGLSNSSNINGNLFIGTGTINETQYVFYNVKDDSGYIETHKIEMPHAKLKIIDGEEKPYAHFYYVYKEYTWFQRIFLTEEKCKSFTKQLHAIFYVHDDEIYQGIYYDIREY